MILKLLIVSCLSLADSASNFAQWSDNVWHLCSSTKEDPIRKRCIHKQADRKSEESHSQAIHAVDHICGDLDSYWEKCYTAGFNFLKKNPPPWADDESVYKLSNLVSDTCRKIVPDESSSYKIGNAERAGYDEDRFQCFAKAGELSTGIKKAYTDHNCSSGAMSNWWVPSKKVSECHEQALESFIAKMEKEKDNPSLAKLQTPSTRGQ